MLFKRLGIAIAFFLASVGAYSESNGMDGDVDNTPSYVVQLTDATYDSFVKTNSHVLVELYAPWCGHCKKLEPEYKLAAKMLKEKNMKTRLAAVDATANEGVAGKFELSGYPTIELVVDGKRKKAYDGARDAHSIMAWVMKHERPSYVEIEESEVEALAREGRRSLVVAYVADEKKRLVAIRVSESFVDVDEQFAIVKVKDSSDVRIELHRPHFTGNFDAKKVVYPNKGWNSVNIMKWVDDLRYPVVCDESLLTLERYMYSRERTTFVISPSSSQTAEEVIQILEPVALEFKSIVHIAVVTIKPQEKQETISAGDAKSSLEFYGVDVNKYAGKKAFGLLNDRRGAVKTENGRTDKYLFEDSTITAEGIRTFLKKWQDKKLPLFFKSQSDAQIAANRKFGPDVIELNAHTFNSRVVEAEDKNSFVFYYAPWCGHCKAAIPDWDKLAMAVKEMYPTKKVEIFAIDSTANDLIEAGVKSYPTIIFYPAGESKLRNKVNYNLKDRTFDSYLEFILNNAVEIDDEDSKILPKARLNQIKDSPPLKNTAVFNRDEL